MSEVRDRPVDKDEVEVTSKMIEVGVDAYCASMPDMDPYENIVTSIYRAMRSVSPRHEVFP
jgi:hypothetical protein